MMTSDDINENYVMDAYRTVQAHEKIKVKKELEERPDNSPTSIG
jgi:hypothetical protein